MRQLATIALFVLAASGFALAQDDSFRFFFDVAGVGEQEPRPAGNLSFTNPVVNGSGRLYLYIEYGARDAATNHQDFSGINLEVRVTGPGQITGGTMYNHKSLAGIDRWGTITRKDIITSDDEFGSMTIPGPIWRWGNVFESDKGYGLSNDPRLIPPDADTHLSLTDGSPFGTTLLAYVDFESTGPGTAGIYLANGSSGNAGVTISANDFVYFGFGDAAVLNKKGATAGGPGGPSDLPDAYIIPEPASAATALTALLAYAGAAARRRRERPVTPKQV